MSCNRGSNGDAQASDVLELLLLSTFNGLRELIVSLSAGGCLSPEMIDRIYNSMAPPLDDEGLRDDAALTALRHSLDGSFAHARLAALHGLLEDEDLDEDED